jgi:uncharacterized RDD family membrane protein YckC
VAPSPPAKAVCSSCGTAVPLPARFCNACGKGLELPEPARAEATKPHPIPPDPAPVPDPGPGPRESPPARIPEPEPRPPVEAEAAPSRPGRSSGPAKSPLVMPPPAAAGSRHAGAASAEAATAFPAAAGPRPVPPPGPRALETRPESVASVPEAQPAGFGPRLAAGLIDGVVVAAGQSVILAPALAYWWSREAPQASAEVGFWPILLSLGLVPLALALAAVYYIYYWGVKGATPGKRVLDLVVEAEDGSHPIGVPRASMRLLGYILSGALFGIGFLMIALGGSALHDRLAGTRVVRWRRT